MNYDFGGIWTPDLCWSFMTEKTLSYSVSPDWKLKPDLLYPFKKDKPLSYWVNDGWVVF